MLRIATIEDLELVTKLSLNFSETITQSAIVDTNKVKDLVKAFLTSPPEEKIVLLYGEVGMLAAFVQPFLLGVVPTATELAWWVEPSHRKSSIGKELIEAFEFWAKKLNCKYTIMSCYAANDLSPFYEKQGYSLHEKAYIKEL